MTTASNDQFCPICAVPVAPMARYPRYVCAACAAKVVAPDGRPLRFFNLSLSGGFGAKYVAQDEPYDGSIGYSDGVRCFADEARFGGIVLQTVS